MKNLLLLIFAILITFPACIDVTQGIEGEGPIVTETLEVSKFSKLVLDDAFDVNITQGDEQKVEARGQQNIIDNLKTNVSSDELTLELSSGNYRNFDLTIDITVANLTDIRNDGSGEITLGDFEGSELELYIDGSGNIIADSDLTMENFVNLTIDGSGDIQVDKIYAPILDGLVEGSGSMNLGGVCEKTAFTIDGSGNLETFSLASTECAITVKGSGNSEVWVTDLLDVSIEGSGDVYYRGNPSITIDIDGSGDLIDAN